MKEEARAEGSLGQAVAQGTSREIKETSTVKRVLLLLQCVVDHPGETAQNLAQRLNLPRSSVHRLLATLRANEYVLNDSAGRFVPGLELYRMAGRLGMREPYRKLAEPYLHALSAQFHETSLLTLLERQQLRMFHVATGAPDDPMRYNIRLHSAEPLIWGATARVLLAHLTEEEIARAIKNGEPSPVGGLMPDDADIRSSLKQIREQGYAITHAHRTPNTVGVAAPFFDGDGQVIGSLGFLIPEFRWAKASIDDVVGALQRAATELSRQLGYRAVPM